MEGNPAGSNMGKAKGDGQGNPTRGNGEGRNYDSLGDA